MINYQDLKLAWFDYQLKGLQSKGSDWSLVQIFTMGAGDGNRVLPGAVAEVSEYPGRINHDGYW
jgi:hypothetical protein